MLAHAHLHLNTPTHLLTPPSTHVLTHPFPDQGHFIISPRVTFEVPVRILGGLMALGYEIGSIMRRTSEVYSDDRRAGILGCSNTSGCGCCSCRSMHSQCSMDGTLCPSCWVPNLTASPPPPSLSLQPDRQV